MTVQEIKTSLLDAIQTIQDEVDAADKTRKDAVVSANQVYSKYHEDARDREQKIKDRVAGLQTKLQAAENDQETANRAAVQATINGDDERFAAAQQAAETASSRAQALTALIGQMEEGTVPRNAELFGQCSQVAAREACAWNKHHDLCKEMEVVAEDAIKLLAKLKDTLHFAASFGSFHTGFVEVKDHFDGAKTMETAEASATSVVGGDNIHMTRTPVVAWEEYDARKRAETAPNGEQPPPVKRQGPDGAWTEEWDSAAGKYVKHTGIAPR